MPLIKLEIKNELTNTNINTIKNAKLNVDTNTKIKDVIKTSIKDSSNVTLDDYNNLKSKENKLVIHADSFVDKLLAIQKVQSTSSDAKDKLLKMRFGKGSKGGEDLNKFNELMTKRKSVIKYTTSSGNVVFLIDPITIKSTLEKLEALYTINSSHYIIDELYNVIPTSSKVADLQEFLGVKIDGKFGVETITSLYNLYIKKLFLLDESFIDDFECLIKEFINIFGGESKYGKISKGLMAAKEAITLSNRNLLNDIKLENLISTIEENLTEPIKKKLVLKIRSVCKSEQI